MKTREKAKRTTIAALAAFLAFGTALPAHAADTLTVFDWSGYEDPAFFRRLFRRTTGLAPGAYRKRFRIPAFARP